MSSARCLMCGMAILSDAKSYERHIEQHHSLDGYSVKIKPINTSGRTKAQIVEAMETSALAPYIVVPDAKPEVVPVVKAPAAYCGIDGKVCVWEDNGWEICGPCARLREAEKVMVA